MTREEPRPDRLPDPAMIRFQFIVRSATTSAFALGAMFLTYQLVVFLWSGPCPR